MCCRDATVVPHKSCINVAVVIKIVCFRFVSFNEKIRLLSPFVLAVTWVDRLSKVKRKKMMTLMLCCFRFAVGVLVFPVVLVVVVRVVVVAVVVVLELEVVP